MIYRALVDLAEREELLQDTSYEPQAVGYLLVLGKNGELLDVLEPRDPPRLDKKGRPVGKLPAVRRAIPRRSDRTAQDKAEFLVDKAEYVFGIDPKGSSKPAKLENRRRRFREAVESAVAALPDSPGLNAVRRFLAEEPPPRITRLLTAEKESERVALAGALFAFVYQPDGGARCVHDEPSVKQYFRTLLDSEDEPLLGQCLVTGQSGVRLTRLHAKPKGIPPKGKTKGGVPLTSVNADSFKSYGLGDVGGAPISRVANFAVEVALNRLLDPAYPGPAGQALPRRNLQIGPDTVIVYWTRREAALDFMAAIDEKDPAEVGRILGSPYRAFAAPLEDPTAFYALVLSGTTGRAIVRSFLDTTVRDVAANVERYRLEAEIVRPFNVGPGGYPLQELCRSLVARGDLDLLPPALGTQLYLCILSGRPFPQTVLDAAIRRFRAHDFHAQEEKRDFLRFGPRCSLLKAYFNRNLTRKEGIPVSLDISRLDPPYRLGRLLAVVEKVQQEALLADREESDKRRVLNATVVDRFYGAASSTPAAVFPALLRRFQMNLGKLRREKPGLAVDREKLVQEIVSELGSFPATLGIANQGLFALGFYHQKQDLFTKKREEN